MMFSRREVLKALGACGLMPVAAKTIIARQIGRLPAPDEVPVLDVPARIVTPQEFVQESVGRDAIECTLRMADSRVVFKGFVSRYEISTHPAEGLDIGPVGAKPLMYAEHEITLTVSGPVSVDPVAFPASF